MRVIIDTNIWVSGLLWGGMPNQVLQRVRQGAVQALTTEPLLAEIARTFAYPKLQPKLQQRQETPSSLLLTVQELTQPCIPVQLIVSILRDTKDLVVLEAAVGGMQEGSLPAIATCWSWGNSQAFLSCHPKTFSKGISQTNLEFGFNQRRQPAG
jgi:putative PIN family toxin of toxin-antitoxin system